MTSVASAILTVGGTPTEFLPLATPWPSGDGCAANIYLHTPVSSPNTFLAFDPLFGASMVASARSCLPPQVTSWWNQGTSASPYIALGPTFVCPQAYSAVQTVLVATSLQQVFCCPSQYSFLVPQPNRGGVFPSQCMSTISSGQTFAFLSNQAQSDAFTATVVMSTTATVFGIPVNGFNFATGSISSSSTSAGQSATVAVTSQGTAPTTTAPPTSTGSSSQQTSSKTPSTSPSLGETVGISIAVVFSVLLVGVVAYVLWKRRKQARPKSLGPVIPNPEGRPPLSPREMPADHISKVHYVYELSEG
ncbi:uncharacterized protein PAC_06554 [Phialocephala subalpina]|uniref:Uncharacterized protein n=1 Tax=Phialocephala subalpina TaxID=576137 RepID=A0A1L7WV57_9HELO|nr:uncharacterized protein PAC_06554 [Phialocephala subalpina]